MKNRYVDIEVASVVLVPLVDALEARDAFPNSDDIPEASHMRTRGHRISWSSFCGILRAAVAEFGEAGVKQIAADLLTAPHFRRRTRIARALMTLPDAFQFMLHSRSSPDFPTVSSFVNLEPGMVEISAYLGESYEPSPEFFNAVTGAVEGLVELFELEGTVKAELTPTSAQYRIFYEEPAGRAAALKRVVSRSIRRLLLVPSLWYMKEVVDRRTWDLQEELSRRHLAERRLAASEESMQRRIENIRDVIFELDSEQRLVYVSPNVESVLGYSRNQVHDDPLVIVPEESREAFQRMLESPTQVAPLRLRDVEGNLRWFELSLTGFAGQVENYRLIVARDIEQRLRLDEEMRGIQKLETLGVVAGSVAHDFNNLLVPVLGNIEFLLGELPEEHNLREVAEQIQTSAMKASELTTQLLLYTGERSSARTTFDLSAEVHAMLRLMRASIPRDIQFDANIEPELFTTGDRVQLRQVLLNLVTNAAESVDSTDGRVALSVGRAGDSIRIRVIDNGSGLDAYELEQMFTPFYTTKVAGRGMGLAVAKDTIAAHDGKISVDSEKGVGSVFQVLLHRAKSPVVVQSDLSMAEGAGQTVLIIDDEDDVRQVGERILRKLGYATISTGDVDDALELFIQRHQQINVVMLDVMMPKRSGLELMGSLRELSADKPILLVTGFGSELADSHADLPYTDILRKPYRINELASALKSVQAHVNTDGDEEKNEASG